MAETFTTTLATLPTRDQAAWRLVVVAVSAGALAGDPHETVGRCYALADAYLSVARESWKAANGKTDAAGTDAAAHDEKEATGA